MTVRWHLKHERHGDKPWAVQAEALRRCNGAERYGFFLEQGLGKTALNLNEFIEYDDVELNVVLAPSSFKADWPLAPDEWGVGFIPTGMYPDDPMPFEQEMGLYAIAHETVRQSERTQAALLQLFKTRRCMLTIDESTGIKNPRAVLSKYCIDLTKYAVRVRELNGTPLVQNVMDYYAQLRVLGELNGVNPFQFRNRFAVMGGYMGRQIKGIKNEDELARILDRVSFRALKKDWRKGLPPQLQETVHLEMTDNQRRHYVTMMDEFYAEIGDDGMVTADMVLTQRNKLQQISSCMLMGENQKVHWIEPPEKNPKLRAVFDVIESGFGKIIVPYVYKASGAMLIEAFKAEKLEPAYIMGGMKPAEITEQKRRFNKDPQCRVLVGQIDQTSRGHTLLGESGNDRCNKIAFYENSLSLMHRLQMQDRNHRGEQDQPSTLFDFVSSPVEQLNIDILTGKKSLADGMDALVAEVRKHGRKR